MNERRLNTWPGSTLIGNKYPFFCGNERLGSRYYQYQVISPGLAEDSTPLLSLTKLMEKTIPTNEETVVPRREVSFDRDLLRACMNTKQYDLSKEGVLTEYLSRILVRENPEIIEDGKKFPSIKMKYGNGLVRSLIVGLRDSLRWKTCRYFDGRLVDVLYTPKTFLVLTIKVSDEKISFEPFGLYDVSDLELKNPLPVDLSKLEYPKGTFVILQDINRELRKRDLESFDRSELI